MTGLEKYATVCGVNNPFTGITNVGDYGFNAVDYHLYIMAFHPDMPVINDFAELAIQISRTFLVHKSEWDAMFSTIPPFNNYSPLTQIEETETTTHSGKDEFSSEGTATDKKRTYDSGTMTETGETGTDSGGSTTYGHVITKTSDYWADGSPSKSLLAFRNLAEKNAFFMVMNEILSAISCKIYKPEWLYIID